MSPLGAAGVPEVPAALASFVAVRHAAPLSKANGFFGAFCDFADRIFLEGASGLLKRIATGYLAFERVEFQPFGLDSSELLPELNYNTITH
ncbi:hypothetical protein [Rhizobium leguminosarum]|uniref:hypothetical protein n=1 Tax=Rhizobium leguminosarum TaxID=384 RepID=UPI001031BAB3|nr:hypothetical protein [Rhizobium leguminosarum]TAU84353.1 hypothetical protein ELI40_14375 [Rhizobium leguminosarum]